jgi:hypothetical protein
VSWLNDHDWFIAFVEMKMPRMASRWAAVATDGRVMLVPTISMVAYP